jgi:ubiquinone/menaquinone biosynthesis C-methylase UbiE
MRPDENHWFDESCARAFWDQRHAVPYQELLRDTVAWLAPRPGERWLDLGCGCGQLTTQLWQQSAGRLAQVVAFDCASVNAEAIDRLRSTLAPTPAEGQLMFQTGNFSDGLPTLPSATFDGIVSGLAISYAESRDETGRWTDAAYNRVLAEAYRVLRPGGRLVFSVNVPSPRFWRILWRSLWKGLRTAHLGRVLLNALKMQRYGSWLKREAARGRFHYLPLEGVLARLEAAGFVGLEHRRSYAGQAFIFRAHKAALPSCRPRSADVEIGQKRQSA